MLALHSCDDSQLRVKNIEKKSKNCKIRKKSKNFKIPYENLEKYGSFSEFRTSMKKSVMLSTLLLPFPPSWYNGRERSKWQSFEVQWLYRKNIKIPSAQRLSLDENC